MPQNALTTFALIVGVGLLAQWVAWRIRVPAILLLLGSGVAVGPGLGWLNPDQLLGPLLRPIVSLGVAVILFEGGLGLKLRDIRGVGADLFWLLSLGVLITWVGAFAAGHYVLKLDLKTSCLLGAILTVTGPTVVGPLLKHMRLGGRAGAILRWEGIAVDPVGAVLAALVFQILAGGKVTSLPEELLLTAIAGTFCGIAATGLLVLSMKYYLAPDRLHAPLILASVLCVFSYADLLQPESGVVAVTVMGICFANQRAVPMRHVLEFKEGLTILLLSCLFVLLGARVDLHTLGTFGARGILFLVAMIFIVRPVSVLVSTINGGLSWKERLFIASMAPRGIVAVAVASVFALELARTGIGSAHQLVPAVFLTIFGTAIFYGIFSPLLAKKLGLIHRDPQGVLFVGANAWVRGLASALKDAGCEVCVADTDRENVAAARMQGINVFYGSILSEHADEEIDTSGMRRLVALTSNDELNALACQRYAEEFGRQEVYHLPFKATEGRLESVSADRRGRDLIGPGMTFEALISALGEEPQIKSTKLTEQFDYGKYEETYAKKAIPLFLLGPDKRVSVFAADSALKPKPGDTIVGLVPEGVAATTRPADNP